jgi:hypothetical protein
LKGILNLEQENRQRIIDAGFMQAKAICSRLIDFPHEYLEQQDFKAAEVN